AVLRRLAYYFDYEFADGRDPAQYVAPAREKIGYWCDHYCPFGFTYKSNARALILRDRRPGRVQESGLLTGLERAAYEYLDAAHSFKAIQAHLNALGCPIDEEALRSRLEDWVHKGWVAREADWFLSL